MYFITTKRMLEVCFSAHPNIQYRTVFFMYYYPFHSFRLASDASSYISGAVIPVDGRLYGKIEGGQLAFLWSLGVPLKKRTNIWEKLLGLLNPHMPAMEDMLLWGLRRGMEAPWVTLYFSRYCRGEVWMARLKHRRHSRSPISAALAIWARSGFLENVHG